MTRTLYLAWRYLAYHRLKTAILITSITLILYLPVGLRVLVGQSSEQLTARAVATPLVVGAKGSPLELVLDTILTIQGFVVAGALVLGLATLATAALVFLLSLRLRQREITTLFKIGGSRLSVASVMVSEIVVVLLSGALVAGGLTALTSRFGSLAIRTVVRLWG